MGLVLTAESPVKATFLHREHHSATTEDQMRVQATARDSQHHPALDSPQSLNRGVNAGVLAVHYRRGPRSRFEMAASASC